MRYIAGTIEANEIEFVLFNGEKLDSVIECNTETGLIIRLLTKEEIKSLITKPGIIMPGDRHPTIQEYGKVEVIMRSEDVI